MLQALLDCPLNVGLRRLRAGMRVPRNSRLLRFNIEGRRFRARRELFDEARNVCRRAVENLKAQYD